MLYLLDANVLFDANRDYYPVALVPESWSWLTHVEEQEKTKIPQEIYEEFVRGHDPLSDWIKDSKNHMLLGEFVRPDLVDKVIRQGYADDLTDEEITKMGRDPFLVAHASLFRVKVVSSRQKHRTRRGCGRTVISPMFASISTCPRATPSSFCASSIFQPDGASGKQRPGHPGYAWARRRTCVEARDGLA